MSLQGLPYCVRVAYAKVVEEHLRADPRHKDESPEFIQAIVDNCLLALEMRFQIDTLVAGLVEAMELLAEDKVDLS